MKPSLVLFLDLPMASLSVRRESTPPDSHHVHRSHSNAASGVRRRGESAALLSGTSELSLDPGNLDTLTRRSIQNPGMDRQEVTHINFHPGFKLLPL